MGRDDNKREKLARIRAAAAELFTTRGFDETSVAEIAERAGVAKGTVFLYATTKADLVALVFEEALREETRAAVAALDAKEPLHAELLRVFSRFFAIYEKSPALARLVLRELTFAGGQAQRVRDAVDAELLGGLAAHVESRKTTGDVSADVPGMVVATNAFALYLLALLAWLTGAVPSRAAAEGYLASSLELACRGLHLAAPAPRPITSPARRRGGTKS